MVSQEDSVVVLDTGAAANLVCSSWLAHRNSILKRHGIPKVATYRSHARFRFGYGRFGEVRHAADVPVGIDRKKGMFTACVLEGDAPALLRKGVMEAPG